MKICFELSMPGVGSWNGRWTGEDRYFAIVRDVGKDKTGTGKAAVQKGRFTYGWSDGWRAGVDAKEVTSAEAAKIRKKSEGFCGYDWMVDSILRHGRILADHEATP